jgi:hypothetical protein
VIRLSLDSELAHGEIDSLLLLAQSNQRRLFLGQAAAHGASLLGTEIGGHVLGLGILEAEGLALLLAQDGEGTGNGLADGSDLSNLGGGTVGHLLDAKRGELGLEVTQVLQELGISLLAQLKGLHNLVRGLKR